MKELFQKIWQNELQFLNFDAKFQDKNKLNTAECAIILSVNKDNYERYFLLKEFQELCKKIDLRVDIFSIQNAQICILNFLNQALFQSKICLRL